MSTYIRPESLDLVQISFSYLQLDSHSHIQVSRHLWAAYVQYSPFIGSKQGNWATLTSCGGGLSPNGFKGPFRPSCHLEELGAFILAFRSSLDTHSSGGKIASQPLPGIHLST